MGNKRCASCHRAFRPCPQVPEQSFCSRPDCQRERRRRWQLKKRREDPDYRDNDARYRNRWAAEHPDYWKLYRATHPDYVERNRSLQQKRNCKQRSVRIANVDALTRARALPPGQYRLSRVASDEIAKVDAWIVEITVLSAAGDESSGCLQSEDVIGTAADN